MLKGGLFASMGCTNVWQLNTIDRLACTHQVVAHVLLSRADTPLRGSSPESSAVGSSSELLPRASPVETALRPLPRASGTRNISSAIELFASLVPSPDHSAARWVVTLPAVSFAPSTSPSSRVNVDAHSRGEAEKSIGALVQMLVFPLLSLLCLPP